MPGKEGLVHSSELADYRVPSVEDVVKLGDEIMVMVTEVDRSGKVSLSAKAVSKPERSLSCRQGTGAAAPTPDLTPTRRQPEGPRGERGRRTAAPMVVAGRLWPAKARPRGGGLFRTNQSRSPRRSGRVGKEVVNATCKDPTSSWSRSGRQSRWECLQLPVGSGTVRC